VLDDNRRRRDNDAGKIGVDKTPEKTKSSAAIKRRESDNSCMNAALTIRAATPADDDAIWRILEPAFRAGETYPIPPDISRADALAYWRTPGHSVFVAEDGGAVSGTYYLRANNRGGGAHVANCGYIVAADAQGRGVARAMCEHSLGEAKSRGFTAMQFNFVIASNERAVRLWQSCGFKIVGTVPQVFAHPASGLVDAHVMVRTL
jgi:ribosomal protein S18 acetylase RimI-like enzyme